LRELNERGVWKIASNHQFVATSTQNLAQLAAQGMLNAELYAHLRKQPYKLP
jgi:transcriptional regulator of acetoin/glycerol metabolism